MAISAVLAVARLIRRQTTQFALSGVIGVAFGAFVATRTGNAEDFFLPGILINAGSAPRLSDLDRWSGGRCSA